MGLPYQIHAQNRTYTVVDDLTTYYRALITGAVVDEVSGGPPRTQFSVQADLREVTIKTLEGGLFCIAGYAEHVFPDPTQTYSVNLRVTAPGYRDAPPRAVTIPAAPSFPIPVSSPIELRSLPVRIQGRAIPDPTPSPIPTATVLVVNPSPPPPAPPEYLVALRTPLSFDHASGTSARDGGGRMLTLVREANAGDGVVFLSRNPTDSIDILDGPRSESRPLGAVTDAEGFYHLNGIGRVSLVKLHASTIGPPARSKDIDWIINYGQPINVVDFRL